MIKTSQLGTSFVKLRTGIKTQTAGGYSGNIKDLYSGGIYFKSLLDILRTLSDFSRSIQSNAWTVLPSGHDHHLPSSLKFIIHLSANNELCVM